MRQSLILMLIVFGFVLLTVILLLLLTFVSFLISESSLSLSREELSSYECGFEHHSLSRIPLSIRYFMLTLVFLVFDMEVMLLAYFPLFSSCFLVGFRVFVYLVFVLLLLCGLLFE